MKDYTYSPTKARIFWNDESDGLNWNLDGIDAERNYTEACARFASWSEAMAEVPAFWAEYIAPNLTRLLTEPTVFDRGVWTVDGVTYTHDADGNVVQA